MCCDKFQLFLTCFAYNLIENVGWCELIILSLRSTKKHESFWFVVHVNLNSFEVSHTSGVFEAA